MESATLNILLDKVFAVWSQVTGFDPEQDSWNLGADYDLHQQAEDLQESRQLDLTGVTTFMLMKAFVEEYLEDEKLTALDLIRGLSDEQQARLDALSTLYKLLEQQEVEEGVAAFIESVRLATEHYKLASEELQAWLGNRYQMSLLRRDAFLSFKELKTHQFYHGEPAKTKRCMYGTKILEFWNIPSLVRAMKLKGIQGVRGIDLCLIRDPSEALNSFFVISVVNGQSLTILTDQEPGPHPLYGQMSRRPDRNLERRAAKNWFPYELLDLEVSADERRMWAKARDKLVPFKMDAVAIHDFKDLHPGTAIWLSLLFELIRENFLIQNNALPELSYTAEMIRRPTLLEPRKEIVEAGKYQSLEAPYFHHDDVSLETTKDQWLRDPSGINEWMIERYGEKVPEEALNVVGDEELAQLPEKAGALADYSEDLLAMSPMTFGTKEVLERDRLWTARFNQCKVVGHFAWEEYEKTHKEVRSWMEEHVQARKDLLLEAMIRGTWMTQALVNTGGFNKAEVREVDLIKYYIGSDWSKIGHYKAIHLFDYVQRWYDHIPACPFTGSLSTSYHVVIHPRDGQSLAVILGLSLEDLPWQLQVWHCDENPHYEGNPILNRIDPAGWTLHNPWCGQSHRTLRFPLDITASISKRGVNKMRKKLGLPKMDWKAADNKWKYELENPEKIYHPDQW